MSNFERLQPNEKMSRRIYQPELPINHPWRNDDYQVVRAESRDTLAEVGAEICVALQPNLSFAPGKEKLVQELTSGETLRPSGTYAVRIAEVRITETDDRQSTLIAENVNARGDKPTQLDLLDATQKAIKLMEGNAGE
ncbi:MAG: hypothetical protein FJ044_01745 [Candidatus Cloacimonetes bacterium]|nr:hypothetical protein [Candidatus Cloacimonadota bacterium]